MREPQILTATIQTKCGPVDLPVDENWHEYSEDERERIRELIETMYNGVNLSGKEFTEFCVGVGYSARSMTQFFSLEEAKKASDGYVVMEGDWGGQIYLTCPTGLVKCGEEALRKLLSKIDQGEWGCNEGGGASMSFGRAKPGDGVSGGMGGGAVTDGLWIHGGISPKLAGLIRRVISGESDLNGKKSGNQG